MGTDDEQVKDVKKRPKEARPPPHAPLKRVCVQENQERKKA